MTRASTRHRALPAPDRLERRFQSLAVLDAALSPEWEYRYHSFNRRWDTGRDHRMGSMRNGSGDELFALFSPSGAALKGWAHEAPMARPGSPPAGIFEGFPAAIEGFLDEPAFAIEDTTFCLWCGSDGEWAIGPVRFPEGRDDPDGSAFLLERFAGGPGDYQSFAREVFEVEVPLEAIERIYAHEPLTEALVHSVSADASLGALAGDLDEIGYPVAG